MRDHQKENNKEKIPVIEKNDYHKLLTLRSEGRTSYQTLNGFYLAACTLAFLALVELYTDSHHFFASLVGIFGMFICFQWFLATWRHHTELRYWERILKKTQQKLGLTRIILEEEDYQDSELLRQLWPIKDGKQMKWNKTLSEYSSTWGKNLFIGGRMKILPFWVGLLFYIAIIRSSPATAYIVALIIAMLIIVFSAYPMENKIRKKQTEEKAEEKKEGLHED